MFGAPATCAGAASAAVVPDPAVQRSRRRVVRGRAEPRQRPRAAEQACPVPRDAAGDGHFAACHLVGEDGEPARIAAAAYDGARSR